MGSMWDKVRGAGVTGGGTYFEALDNGGPAKYRVRISGCKQINGHNGMFAAIETEVLESEQPKRPAGSKCSHVIKLGAGQEMGPINVKAFLASALSIDNATSLSGVALDTLIEERATKLVGAPTSVEQILDLVFDDTNCCIEGIEMSLTATLITTKKEKKPFTKIVWDPSTLFDASGEPTV